MIVNASMDEYVNAISNYANQHIDQDNKTKSLIDFFAPGALALLFKGLNLTWFGMLVSFALSVFHISIYDFISSIFNKFLPNIKNDVKMTAQEIEQTVNSTVEEKLSQAKELTSSYKVLKKEQLASYALISNGAPASFLGLFSSVVSWLFKAAFTSAGIMVAADATNKVLERPNAFDGNLKDNQSQPTVSKYPINPSYQNTKKTNWVEEIPNTPQAIDSFLFNLVLNVYQLPPEKQNLIPSTPAFKLIKSRIIAYNRSAEGDELVVIPRNFTSEKQIADLIINDL